MNKSSSELGDGLPWPGGCARRVFGVGWLPKVAR